MKNEVHFNELNLEKKSPARNQLILRFSQCMRACDLTAAFFFAIKEGCNRTNKMIHLSTKACVLSGLSINLCMYSNLMLTYYFQRAHYLECFLVPSLKFQFPVSFQEKLILYSFVPGWKSFSLNGYDNVNSSILLIGNLFKFAEIRSCLNCRYTVSLSFITSNRIFYATNLLEFTPGNMCTKVLFMAYCFYLRIRGYYWLPCMLCIVKIFATFSSVVNILWSFMSLTQNTYK